MVVLELLLLGLIFQVLSGGKQFTGLHWPFNILAATILIILLIFIHLFFRRRPFIKWLSSIPAAISSISFFAFVVLLMGFIPQQNPDAPGFIKILGLTSIRNGWLLVVSGLYLLTCLGLVILRRIHPVNQRNIGFLLNHTGLWIIILAGSLGSGNLIRATIQLTEGDNHQKIGVDQAGHAVSLPFNLKLLDFKIDEYPPKIGIVDVKTGEMIEHSEGKFIQINENLEHNINDWKIRIEKIFIDGFPGQEDFFSSDSAGTAPAALVKIQNLRNGSETMGWISCGSYTFPPAFLPLDNNYVLFMNKPEPEKFSSLIEIFHDDKTDTVIIEVNKPIRIKRFSLYQLSYDERMGKWSDKSVIEAVKDPWLPAVYIGIFMMLGGSVYLFWKGNEIRKE